MTQKRSSEFLLTASGIQHRVPRRIQLRHPARLVAGLRALCYLPALRLQDLGLSVPDLSPTDNSATRHPLRSAGFPTHRFPYPQRYYGVLRLPADHFAALRLCFAWRYHPASPVFAPLRPDDVGLGPGTFGFGRPLVPIGYRDGAAGPPKFLGSPDVPMPCSSTPARPIPPGCCGGATRPPCPCKPRALAGIALEAP